MPTFAIKGTSNTTDKNSFLNHSWTIVPNGINLFPTQEVLRKSKLDV